MARKYQAHETARMQELDGLVLADFGQRAAAFVADVIFAALALMIVLFLYGLTRWAIETGADLNQHRQYHIRFHGEVEKLILELVVPILYFGLSSYFSNGRTLGKRLFGIRVVSLVHDRMSLWHSIERALGYGAAALEFGFGFLQFFIHPFRRTAQDRLAETIVVKESSYQERFGAGAGCAEPAGVTVDAAGEPAEVQ
jgi:uncharacterized RDD family membrane protein YckC